MKSVSIVQCFIRTILEPSSFVLRYRMPSKKGGVRFRNRNHLPFITLDLNKVVINRKLTTNE